MLLVVGAGLVACGGGAKSPPTGAGRAKGVVGQYYYVNLFTPPLGGVVESSVGGLKCGALHPSQGGRAAAPYAYYADATACGVQGQTRVTWTQGVRLTATGRDGNAFLGWSGDCAGTGPCDLSAGADKAVTALFGPPGSGHTNVADPALHGPMYSAFTSGGAGALQCTTCHGAVLRGQGIAPSCAACHPWPLAVPAAPVIASFTATPASITVGQVVTLAWSVTGAERMSLDQGIGEVAGTSATVSPAVTTTYTLTATNAFGSVSSTATVTVAPQACAPGGAFTSTGAMAEPRDLPTATRLLDGSVLVTGGSNTLGTLASAEVYDPASGQFTPVGSMSQVRIGHTATLLPDGSVLIAGGTQRWSTTPSFRTAELYDPVTRTFTPTGSLNVARYGHTATRLLDGKVLVAGGDQFGYYPAEAELYDPATGLFTLTGQLLSPRAAHGATLLANGDVLLVGGYLYNIPQSSAELYTPAAGVFSSIGNMNSARGGGFSAVPLVDGRVVIAGGDGGRGVTSSAEIFDPVTLQFSGTGGLASPRRNFVAMALPDGQVLVAGGLEDSTSTIYASSEVYDSTIGRFRTASSMGTPRVNASAVILARGQILVVGGWNAEGLLASAELYSPLCGGISGLGPASALSSIPTGANGTCWFSAMERAVQTATDGLTRVATAEHRFCDTGVDAIRVHTRAAGGTWSSQAPFSYDYSPYRPANTVWFRGLPGVIAGAVDASGGMHVISQNRRSTSGSYDFTDGLVYAWGGAAPWQAVETGVGDGAVQVASGNPGGAPFAGLSANLAFDPAAGLLRFFGHDGAWFATAYHVLETTAGPGNTPPWAPLAVVTTSIGAVDRGAIVAEAQDFSGAAGVQVWIDGPTCRLKGREQGPGGWTQTIDVPLGYAGCSYQSIDYFGFFGHVDVLARGRDLEVVLFARTTSNVSGHGIDVLRLTRTGGLWASAVGATGWVNTGSFIAKALADAAGHLYALHLDATGALALWDLDRGTDLPLRAPPGGGTIDQADVALWNPGTVVWTERAAGTETLYAAPLLR